MHAFGSHCSGALLQTRMPATVARLTPCSSGASNSIFLRPVSGLRAASALNRGFQRFSSSVRKPVSGTGCSSNSENGACPRSCARRSNSSPVIFCFEAPARTYAPSELACGNSPLGTRTHRKSLCSGDICCDMPILTGGFRSADRSVRIWHRFFDCFGDMSCTSPSSVTPKSKFPPSALAKATISLAQSVRSVSFEATGWSPLNAICLNSQRRLRPLAAGDRCLHHGLSLSVSRCDLPAGCPFGPPGSWFVAKHQHLQSRPNGQLLNFYS